MISKSALGRWLKDNKLKDKRLKRIWEAIQGNQVRNDDLLQKLDDKDEALLQILRISDLALDTDSERPEPRTDTGITHAVIASNAAQDIANWLVTSKITRVEVRLQDIIVEHTMSGKWPKILGLVDDPDAYIEGSFWIGTEIDTILYGATFESMRPGQEAKGLTQGEHGGTLATRMPGHVKNGPLGIKVPKAGERWWVMVSTPARGDMAGKTTVHERSEPVWFTWPDFGVVEEPELAYQITNEDYKKVNDPMWIAAVLREGAGSDNLMLPPKFTGKRWRPGGNRTPGTITRGDNTLRLDWDPLWETTVPNGHFGNIHMIYPDGDSNVSRVVADLWRPNNNVGVVIPFALLPYTGPGLCSFTLTTLGDHIHQRKTDSHPWRF